MSLKCTMQINGVKKQQLQRMKCIQCILVQNLENSDTLLNYINKHTIAF